MIFEAMITDLKIGNYSKKTIKSYLFWNEKFIHFIKKKPNEVARNDIKKYLLYLYEKGRKPKTIRSAHDSLKFYYVKMLKRNIFKDIIPPRIPKSTPKTLDKDEINAMIDTVKNQKHKLLILLLYSSGIRVSEAIKVKHNDIFLRNSRHFLFVRQGKGKKDRITLLSDKFMKLYNTMHKDSDGFIFFSRGTHITARTAEIIVKNATKKANIKANVYPHKLRASFATHLFDNGTEALHVKNLLGHSDIKTTINSYLKAKTSQYNNIKSPADM